MSFAVDPDRLRATGRAIAEIAARTSDDLDRLHHAVRVAPWAPVAPAYREVVALTGEALELVGDALAKSGADTQRMAEAYAQTEALVRSAFDRIDAALGGQA